MKRLSSSPRFHARGERAFTLVEIVLSLAIIAIALVAIIGVLPIGLRVQSDNQEEAIVSADAAIWMEAFRNGAQGMEYLAQDAAGGGEFYIDEVMIERVVRDLATGNAVSSNRVYLNSFGSASNLIGLLSTPKYHFGTNTTYTNFNMYAEVRALNGNMADLSSDMDFAFKYRMTPELVPVQQVNPFHLVNTNNNVPLSNLQDNLYELRLNFQWPLIVGAGGNSRGQTRFNKRLEFRTMVSGRPQHLVALNGDILYFMNPRSYQGTFVVSTNN